MSNTTPRKKKTAEPKPEGEGSIAVLETPIAVPEPKLPEVPEFTTHRLPYSDIRSKKCQIEIQILKVWVKRHIIGGEEVLITDNPEDRSFTLYGTPYMVSCVLALAERIKSRGLP
jgi:hypothetical protein